MTNQPQDFNQTVIELFELQVKKTPNLPAIEDDHSDYSYQELNDKANQIAHWLTKKNIRKHDYVAILLEPGTDFIICLLAITKIGAIYVPLDIKAPQSRLETIINDFSPKLIITNETYKNLLINTVTKNLIKNIHLESALSSKENLEITIKPDAPIYLMYTSGSTGSPKGILIPHNAVVNLATIDNYADIKEGMVVGQFSNLAFDACTFEIWNTLLNGGLLSIIPLLVRTDHNQLKKYLQKHHIHCLFLPTSYFHQLIKSYPKTLNSVEIIVFGGEQVNLTLLKNYIQYRNEHHNPVVLINGYGPTEATTFTCKHTMTEKTALNDEELMSIGRPIKNVKTYILDENGHQSEEGELYISGINLALRYLSTQNNEKTYFKDNPFKEESPFTRIYKTGDKVKLLPSGKLLCLGRLDDQVKIGGFRIHLNEIENELMKQEAVSLASVTVDIGGGSHKLLTAYLVLSSNKENISANTLRDFLSIHLPAYMLPSKFLVVDELPLNLVGKVDKNKLVDIPHTELFYHIDTSSESAIEESIKRTWQHLLNSSNIDVHKNLFECGANSILMLEACSIINNELHTDLQISQLFAHPTIHRLSRFIEGDIEEEHTERKKSATNCADIAIIGMSCRFPKANSIHEFWDNLCKGKVSYGSFTKEQLGDKGFKLDDENFVPVRGILSDIEYFDANFFGFNPMDASITDPQQRLFLECTSEALEQAAVIASQPGIKISIFAGMADSTYLHENLLKNRWIHQETDRLQQRIATSIGMLSTQTSYHLNLKGRSLNINTACSTGLVSVAEACRELMMGTSDVAVAGAVSIVVPQVDGYLYKQGSIESEDGQCRPFDANANGTVFSNGAGVVVLKRLDDAKRDNNTIFAVIKGAGVNNDGSDKLGYTAPSVSGQIECIRDALLSSKINADEVGYLEAHGTATSLGDVVEIEALSSAFTETTDRKQYCVLGSVKGNIGHMDIAAGMGSLIKTALCLYHQQIPPMPNFKAYNPHIDFKNSPFFINTKLMDWSSESAHRYAGISAFGVGGTNVHLILGDYIKPISKPKIDAESLIILSAKSEEALHQSQTNLVDFVGKTINTTPLSLTDLAYTLQTGRESYPWRSFCIAKTKDQISRDTLQWHENELDLSLHSSIIFMFPGQGMQYHKMAFDLLKIPFYSSWIKRGVKIAKSYLDIDLLELINNPDDERLHQTQYAQPALFLIEYALAQLFIHLGVKPNAVIGHSIGEYVAACLAGIFSFEDAIALVCQRGFLMATAPKGEMIAVDCSKEEIKPYLKNTDLALHNSLKNVVVAGLSRSIEEVKQSLEKSGILYYPLKVSHAFHSKMMEGIEQSFKGLFSNLTLSPPSLPMISNLTGTWLSVNEAINLDYWYRHLRHTVEFYEGIETLLEDSHPLFIEIGPGQSLNRFLKPIANLHQKKVVSLSSLPDRLFATETINHFLTAIGHLWQYGIQIHWQALYEHKQPKLIPLPTYAFQKQRYWITPNLTNPYMEEPVPQMYKPSWIRQKAYLNLSLLSEETLKEHDWVIFSDSSSMSSAIITLLETNSITPIIVTIDNHFRQDSKTHFKINPYYKSDYENLFKALKGKAKNLIVLHLYSYTNELNAIPRKMEIDDQLTRSFDSLLYLTQSYLQEFSNQSPLNIAVITSGTELIIGTESINPINATLRGACRVIMQEYPQVKCKLFDLNPIENPEDNKNLVSKLIDSSLNINWNENTILIPLRHGYQWIETFTPALSAKKMVTRLKNQGVYLITGGLGGIALSLSEAIAKTVSHPILVLISRRTLPNHKEWDFILQNSNHNDFNLIQKLHRLEKLGATVIVKEVDIAEFEPLNDIIQECIERFGKINGLIHTAGLSIPTLAELTSKEISFEIFKPKIYGTFNLIKALEPLSLDFVVLTSSLAALLGGYQQLAYSSANSSLDAFSKSLLLPSCSFILSINWNTWKEVGIAANAALKGEANFLGQGNDITTSQGQALFLQSLQGNDHQVAISNRPIESVTVPKLQEEPSSSLGPKINRQSLKIAIEYSPPENDIERKLIQLWQGALGIENIGIHDNFFSLGGHSLKAISLIAKINKAFNSTLPVTQIYQDSTIRKMSKTLLMDNQKSNFIEPILLKQGNEQCPYLFLCHPISGLINCFNDFVSQSKLPMPIYGIQDPGINTTSIQFDNFQDIVAHYFTLIRKTQPKGPYYLVGYSYGGAILFEVANKLLQLGEKINLLALIDSWAIHSSYLKNEESFKEYLRQTNQLPEEIINLAWQREQKFVNHEFHTIDQEILLYKAAKLTTPYQDIKEPYNGWSKYNKSEILCHAINSDHDNMLSNENSINILQSIECYLKKKDRKAYETFKKSPE